MVHAAYVLNVATAEPEKWARAARRPHQGAGALDRARVGAVCFHPGSASDGDRAAALGARGGGDHCARSSRAGRDAPPVENTAGAGKTIGRTAEEVAAILHAVPPALRARTGYGLDTCHLFASGYDIRRSQAALAAAARRVRGRHRRAAVVLPPQRQRGRAGLEPRPAHAARRGADRRRAVPLAARRPPQPRHPADPRDAAEEQRRRPATTPRPTPGMPRCSRCCASWRPARRSLRITIDGEDV